MPNSPSRLAPLLILAICFAAPSAQAQGTDLLQLDEKELKYFAKQFKTKCARCHGAQGDGAGSQAGDQGVAPASFTDAAFMAAKTDEEFAYQIDKGGEELSAMPAFGPGSDHAWNHEKIAKMVAFLRTLGPPPTPAAPSGPAATVPETAKPGIVFYAAEDGVSGHTRGLLQEKNLEEVYLNYSYFSATYDEANRVLTFQEYRKGEVVLTETYSYDAEGRHTKTLRVRAGQEPETLEY